MLDVVLGQQSSQKDLLESPAKSRTNQFCSVFRFFLLFFIQEFVLFLQLALLLCGNRWGWDQLLAESYRAIQQQRTVHNCSDISFYGFLLSLGKEILC